MPQKYNPDDWTKVSIPKTTHTRIQKLAENEGRKVWAIVDHYIPNPEA